MMKNGIPISPSLGAILSDGDNNRFKRIDKKRLVIISLLAVLIAVCASLIAKFLVLLIYFITNISFYAKAGVAYASPADNLLGFWVIFIPAAGGIVVGLMARYGSTAIRGHGIPEAMEQILTNQSKIKPTITYLKPISSAIAIGTGGPFGAEGPIIATGGALGSTIGQFIRITHNERKILLAAGATAGMAAIFGSPIAAIFLAIELLLFEFSHRSIVPVALACITGAAGHHFLFEAGPVFRTETLIATPTNAALAVYSVMGVIIGLLSVIASKIVYLIEDAFERLPIHWMWWPAIGGLAVGLIGYFSPRTLGVGYNNITDILAGSLSVRVLLSLCVMKFFSWAIALGSGTSGGTLAPLLTIGGAAGALIGSLAIYIFPSSGITVALSALVGMSALFAGASRAFLTSIIFALETTAQSNALLPLLATCGASYIVSLFLMKNTIMTEKIARRGIKTPESYEPDMLEHITVAEVMEVDIEIVSANKSIHETISRHRQVQNQYLVVTNASNEFTGILNSVKLYVREFANDTPIEKILESATVSINGEESLRQAAELMAREKLEVLPVISSDGVPRLIGILSVTNILAIYKRGIEEHTRKHPDLSVRRGFNTFLRKPKGPSN